MREVGKSRKPRRSVSGNTEKTVEARRRGKGKRSFGVKRERETGENRRRDRAGTLHARTMRRNDKSERGGRRGTANFVSPLSVPFVRSSVRLQTRSLANLNESTTEFITAARARPLAVPAAGKVNHHGRRSVFSADGLELLTLCPGIGLTRRERGRKTVSEYIYIRALARPRADARDEQNDDDRLGLANSREPLRRGGLRGDRRLTP